MPFFTKTREPFPEEIRLEEDRRKSRYHDAAYEAERKLRKEELAEWTDATRPIATPIELYAVWLWTWRKSHGPATHVYDYPFQRRGFITPTIPTRKLIPVGYGAGAQSILSLPSLVPINTHSASGDGRGGWEWGHTTLCTLDASGCSLVATTNDRHCVAAYTDVLELWHSNDMDDMCRRTRKMLTSGVSVHALTGSN